MRSPSESVFFLLEKSLKRPENHSHNRRMNPWIFHVEDTHHLVDRVGSPERLIESRHSHLAGAFKSICCFQSRPPPPHHTTELLSLYGADRRTLRIRLDKSIGGVPGPIWVSPGHLVRYRSTARTTDSERPMPNRFRSEISYDCPRLALRTSQTTRVAL